MQINIHYERKDPKDSMSKIIYRAIDLETPLTPECVRKIAVKEMPAHWKGIQIMGIVGRKTRIRAGLDDVDTSSFARFLYQVMNWESNTHHWNKF